MREQKIPIKISRDYTFSVQNIHVLTENIGSEVKYSIADSSVQYICGILPKQEMYSLYLSLLTKERQVGIFKIYTYEALKGQCHEKICSPEALGKWIGP